MDSAKRLHVGSRGADVRRIENQLRKLDYLSGPADGKFDKKTAEAILDFKRDHGWEDPKGVAGERLKRTLNRVAAGDSDFVPANTGGGHTNGAGPTGAAGGKDDDKQPKSLKGGTYNCHITRTPDQVKGAVKKILKEKNLDFIQLQEISRFHGALKSIPGYKLITFPGSKDHGESGVLVREGIKTEKKQLTEAKTGWTAVTGNPAAPRGAVSVELAGWLRVTSVHAPPAINFNAQGEATGPAQRIKSYKSLMTELLKDTRKAMRQDPGMATLIGGDWNEPARSHGVGSPTWLANKLGLKRRTDGGIDWEMVEGAILSKMNSGQKFGSDHPLVTFTITAPKKKND